MLRIWFVLAAASAFGAAISVNGICHVGNCSSPDVAATGSSPATAFNFIVTLPNSDQYRISGSAAAPNSTTGIDIQAPFTVTYLGNSTSTSSGADVLTLDILQNYQFTGTSFKFFENAVGGFSGPIAAGSSLQGQLSVGGQALPLQGPFLAPANFSVSSGSITLSGLATPLAFDLRRTITFAGGSGVGATVYNGTTPSSGATTSGDPLACDGAGSTLPILKPVRAPASDAATATIPSCQIVLCNGTSASGDCSQVAFEGGGSTLPVLAYTDPTAPDGQSGSTLPILVINGSGTVAEGGIGGTLPILYPTGPAGSGGGVIIACCGGSTGTLPVREPVRPPVGAGPNAASASSSGIPVEIVTPLRSIAYAYTATASCPGLAACWLSVPVGSGNIAASTRAAITAVANLQSLAPGTYTANVAITLSPTVGLSPSVLLNVPVTLALAASGPTMALSQTGLHFQAISGAAAPPAQSITVTNSGTGSLAFTAKASTLTGNWLSVAPPSGIAPAQVSIQANPAGLAPGTYYGRVDFTGGAGLQSAEVVLTVSNTSSGPTLSTTGLVFVSASAGSNPAPQTVQIVNPSNQTFTVSTSIQFANGNGWFSANASGSTPTSAQPLAETVSVNAAGLAPGAYLGTMNIHIAETQAVYPVQVLLVVRASSCTPTRLLPVLTNLEGAFQRTAGFPVPLTALVVDDCGTPLTSGAVQAYFPDGDPFVTLTSLGSGQWSGTWMPHAAASGGVVRVGVMATGFAPQLYGSAGVAGSVAANPAAPVVSIGGAVNAASLTSPLAPGTFISIFGNNLGTAVTQASSTPFSTSLGGAQVLLGGEAMPLQIVTPGQINAVVPFDAPLGVTQLIVEQNGAYAMPETVAMASAQPGVFTQNQSGKGAGVIVVIQASGVQFLNTPATPASAGDALVIYGTGLGAVSPPLAAGSATPYPPLTNTVNPVTVTVGGQSAQVLFAGMTPGYVGLYQINAIVPQGVAPGPSVPVVVSTAGASSVPVTVAIQ